MSTVTSPSQRNKERFISPIIIDEPHSDNDRQLCNDVDAMLMGVTRVLQQAANERSANTKLHGATASFLRANGIRIAEENVESGVVQRPFPRSAGGDVGAATAAEALLRTQLEQCRDLLRKVDSERRYLQKQCVHQHREQEQRRSELEAVHRYSAESHQRALGFEHQAAEERQRRRRAEETVDAQTLELMQLRRLLRALPGDVLATLHPTPAPSPSASVSSMLHLPPSPTSADRHGRPLVPDRRFEEAFKDKMNSIVYRRRYRQASKMHQAACEQLEALRMEQHDPQSAAAVAAVQWSTALLHSGASAGNAAASAHGTAAPAAAAAAADAASLAESGAGVMRDDGGLASVDAFPVSTVSALASAMFQHSAIDFAFQLPFSTASPQDPLIKSLVYRSQLAEPLMQVRENTLRLASRLKTAQDAGLRTLYTTFRQSLLQLAGGAGSSSTAQAQARSLYERQMEKMQRAHRDLLYSLMEQVNHTVVEIAERERVGGGASGGRGGLAAVPQRRDVGCSAHESMRVDDYRASQLKEQLSRLKLQSLEAAAAALQEREAAGQRCTMARQEALQALQSLTKLTSAVVTAVRAMGGGAGEAAYDPYAHLHDSLTEDVLDDPRLVTKMAEATDLTLTYVRQLARGAASQQSAPHLPYGTHSSSAPSLLLPVPHGAAHGSGRYGHIIDIHRRDSTSPTSSSAVAPAESKAKAARRGSAPVALNAASRRPRSKSASGVGRRGSLPHVAAAAKARTPTAPNSARGNRGRPPVPSATTAAAAGGTAAKDSASVSRSSPARVDGRSPNAAVAVIELDFDQTNTH